MAVKALDMAFLLSKEGYVRTHISGTALSKTKRKNLVRKLRQIRPFFVCLGRQGIASSFEKSEAPDSIVFLYIILQRGQGVKTSQ